MSCAVPLAVPTHRAPDPATQPSGAAAAWSAAAVTVPHAVGLGLLAFAPLAGDYSFAALAVWSAALPGLLLTLLAPRAGDTDHDLLVVKSGHITLVTLWPPDKGLRLATVGPGMAFGEMAFLNGAARSACAGAERGTAHLVRLSRAHFDAWARQYPEAALMVMNNLAQVGARRLAVSMRQLRAVLE